MNKIWTDAEKEYIRNNAATKKDRELAEELSKMSGRNVTIAAVRKQRQALKIFKSSGRGKCQLKQPNDEVLGVGVVRNQF